MIHLESFPEAQRQTIVVGLVIRKPLDVVKMCFAGINCQELPPGIQLQRHVILDTDDPQVIHEAADIFCQPGDIVECEPPVAGDFSDDGPVTHHWQQSSMQRVGAYKTRILQTALKNHAAAVWLIDADLLCDPGTLKSLWYADNPVVSAVFWTRWQNHPSLHAAPQVWLQHPYRLDGRGYPNEAAFRRRLMSRQLTQVWGLGACTLLRRSVLEAGLTFDYLPGVSLEGMMAGEDRHFCLHCESKHIPMIADPWPHIWHCYHASDREQIPERQVEIACVHSRDPETVKWVNLRLKLLEPIPTGPNAFGLVPPHIVRARIGAGDLLPDLEQQVLGHLDGQPFVAEIHFPTSYEVPWLAGTRRLMDVIVIDAKTGASMPVIEDEYMGPLDLTTYTSHQQETLFRTMQAEHGSQFLAPVMEVVHAPLQGEVQEGVPVEPQERATDEAKEAGLGHRLCCPAESQACVLSA